MRRGHPGKDSPETGLRRPRFFLVRPAITLTGMAAQDDGVFVSRVDADDWEVDEETGGLVLFLRADGDVQAGLWKPGPLAGSAIDLTLAAHETFLVLEGNGQIEVDDGPPLRLEPGVMVSLRKGSKTRWLVDEAFKELWVYS
jgi:uncharacterized cupin superfamily protein